MDFKQLKAYLDREAPEEVLLHFGQCVLYVQTCYEGYDYTFFDLFTRKDLDGGRIDVEEGDDVNMAEALLRINDCCLSLYQDIDIMPLDQVEDYMQ